MMYAADLIPSLLAIIFLLSCLIGFVLKKNAQPKRFRLADVGAALLERPDLPPAIHRQVRFWVDHAFGVRIYLLAILVLLPIAGPLVVYSPKMRSASSRAIGGVSAPTKKLYDEFDQLGNELLFANNPLLVSLAVCVLVISVVLAWPVVVGVRAISRRRPIVKPAIQNVARVSDRDVLAGLIGEIDEKASRLMGGLHMHAPA